MIVKERNVTEMPKPNISETSHLLTDEPDIWT